MSKQAVISLAGKQHLITEGETFSIDMHLEAKEGESVDIDQVLMVTQEDKVIIGTPYVKDASVSLKVVKLGKADKITTARFRAKSRSRRKVGHRQPQTVLEVSGIKFK